MKLSDEQLSFAKAMSARQWGTLRSLTICPFYLSASERADRELYALIEYKLAHCAAPVPGIFALYTWQATDAGKKVIKMRSAGKL